MARHRRYRPASPERWDQLATPLFEHLGLDQGMPHPVAMALAQDGDGFIWIGTQTGLARWDGYRMRSFRHAADPTSLPGDFVQTLHVDVAGRAGSARPPPASPCTTSTPSASCASTMN
jgi:hypothetical protein